MYRLIESIKVYNNELCNIQYHNRRFNKTREDLFGCKDKMDLAEIINIPEGNINGLYKCRLVYSKKIESIEFIPYQKKKINLICVVEDNFIDYKYKYEDRTQINKLLNRVNADDIIIIKNNFLTDASFANIVLSDGYVYLTPSTPLLKGTKRAKLLDEGAIREEELKKEDLKKFKFLYLINAMIDLNEENKIPIERVYF